MVPLNRNTTNHLKSLDSDLEAVHGGDGGLRAARVVEADEPEALALVGGAVNKHLQQYQCLIAGDLHSREILLLAITASNEGLHEGRFVITEKGLVGASSVIVQSSRTFV